jgi:hypothetical protein
LSCNYTFAALWACCVLCPANTTLLCFAVLSADLVILLGFCSSSFSLFVLTRMIQQIVPDQVPDQVDLQPSVLASAGLSAQVLVVVDVVIHVALAVSVAPFRPCLGWRRGCVLCSLQAMLVEHTGVCLLHS